MSFWNHDRRASPDDLIEPLRQNRWYIEIEELFFLENMAFALKECQKPSYSIKVIEHTLLNRVLRYPGVMTWKPIQMKIVSTAGLRDSLFTSGIFYRDVAALGGQYPNLSKSNLLKKINLYQIDELGVPIEKWKLINCFISDVNFGNLTYDNESFVDITFTVQYDSAELSVLDLGEDGYKDKSNDGRQSGSTNGKWDVNRGYPRAILTKGTPAEKDREKDHSVKR